MRLPIGVTQQASGGAVYDPGMMTFDGSTGYYSATSITTSGNLVTGVFRFNRASFTGGNSEFIAKVSGPGPYQRMSVIVYPSDFATTERRNKLLVVSANNTGTNICRLLSDVDVCDGTDKVVFYAFNADTGAAQFYVNGVTADDTGATSRIAPTTGTLDSGASSSMYVGSDGGTRYLGGDIGYCGYREAYLTNPTDFYHPTNGLQELDESGWTEWGAQPLFWNQYGTMTDNKGSAGNMTANGTITGPA